MKFTILDPMAKAGTALEGELASATLKALRASYREINDRFFGAVLRPPTLKLNDSSTIRLGSWDPTLRCIEISSPLLVEYGWGAAIEVLKHEMAHQFVHEVLFGPDEPMHGAVFQQVCRERGIDARASADPTAGDARHPVLDRIRKLLSLAQSPNEHEAQSATRLAQRLMLRHNIEQLSLDREEGYTHRQLGRTTGRVSEAESILGAILQEHFFVDVIWVYAFRPLEEKYGRVMEVCGRSENIELADYVHDFLTRMGERLWEEHKVTTGIRRNRDRRAFVAGVMSGFRDQLDEQKSEQVGGGLIWLGDPKLGDYFKRRHPMITTNRYYERAGDAARDTGRSAGSKIVLHRGITSSREGGSRKQLTPGG
jgi:hypothetical protein